MRDSRSLLSGILRTAQAAQGSVRLEWIYCVRRKSDSCSLNKRRGHSFTVVIKMA